jgi:hypothetical protein
MKRPRTPFPRHWLHYIVRKVAIILAAVAPAFACYEYWLSHGA